MRTKCRFCDNEQNSELSSGFDFCVKCGEMITTNDIIEEDNE